MPENCSVPIRRSMGKEGMEEEKINKGGNNMPSQKGVIISVYVESPTRQSTERPVAGKKTHPKSVSRRLQTPRKRGYDRRAQLLDYARDLRNADPQEVEQPEKTSRSKPSKKWRWLMKPASFCIQSCQTVERTTGRRRYERVPIEKKTEEKEDRSAGSTAIGGEKRKAKATGTRSSHLVVNS